MISLPLVPGRSSGLQVACLGAHCDDIEVGCGGTLLRLREWYPGLRVRWLVLTSDETRAAETRASATRFGLDPADVQIERFRDAFLPYEGSAVKEAVVRHRGDFEPDVVFTHHHGDRHQDHRLVSELTWNAYRDHLILEYEVPKWEGDLGTPNLHVPLEPRHADAKLAILEQEYATQRSRASFRIDAFRGLMALRGVESKAPGGMAEAFHARKLLLGAAPERAP